jgi:hypothetical protein
VAFFHFTNFVTPPSVYRYDPEKQEIGKLWSRQEVPFHGEEFEVKQVRYTSKDGTSVPMFLVHRKDVFYMPFEAFHTAKKRQMGVPVDEWSSLLSHNTYAGRTPIGPILLILIGVLFLLDTLHILEFRQVGRFWPVILIVAGAYMLYSRVSSPAAPPASRPSQQPGSERSSNDYLETRHEQ